MNNFIGKEKAQEYFALALEKMSPFTCIWEGKRYCQGSSEGGSNKTSNDYERALFYIEFAYKCGIEEAKDVYHYLKEHSPDEINNKTYTSSSGCYITTAVCGSLGKPDNCTELTSFRNFRDTYLSHCADGEILIKEYYEIAPQIVSNIQSLPDSAEIYRGIWDEYLSTCYKLILNAENEKCKQLYIKMTIDLKQKYLSPFFSNVHFNSCKNEE